MYKTFLAQTVGTIFPRMNSSGSILGLYVFSTRFWRNLIKYFVARYICSKLVSSKTNYFSKSSFQQNFGEVSYWLRKLATMVPWRWINKWNSIIFYAHGLNKCGTRRGELSNQHAVLVDSMVNTSMNFGRVEWDSGNMRNKTPYP